MTLKLQANQFQEIDYRSQGDDVYKDKLLSENIDLKGVLESPLIFHYDLDLPSSTFYRIMNYEQQCCAP